MLDFTEKQLLNEITPQAGQPWAKSCDLSSVSLSPGNAVLNVPGKGTEKLTQREHGAWHLVAATSSRWVLATLPQIPCPFSVLSASTLQSPPRPPPRPLSTFRAQRWPAATPSSPQKQAVEGGTEVGGDMARMGWEDTFLVLKRFLLYF